MVPLHHQLASDPRVMLAERARRGDASAVEFLIEHMFAHELPATKRRELRNAEIARLDGWLSATLPGSSARCRAKLLARAGDVLGIRRGLPDGPPFDVLDRVECGELARAIRTLVGWERWPGAKQIGRICGNGTEFRGTSEGGCDVPPIAGIATCNTEVS